MGVARGQWSVASVSGLGEPAELKELPSCRVAGLPRALKVSFGGPLWASVVKHSCPRLQYKPVELVFLASFVYHRDTEKNDER